MKNECKILDEKYRGKEGFAGVGYDGQKISLYIVSENLKDFDIEPEINGVHIQIVELESMPEFCGSEE